MAFEKSKEELLEIYQTYEPNLFHECFGYDNNQMGPEAEKCRVTYGLVYDLMPGDTIFRLLIKPGISRETVLKFLDKIKDEVKNNENWQLWNDCASRELEETND